MDNKQIFFVILGAIISGIILGALTSSLYQKKGYNGGFGWGFFLGIVGLIYAAGLPDQNDKKVKTKKETYCPNCGSKVFKYEENCPLCGYKIRK